MGKSLRPRLRFRWSIRRARINNGNVVPGRSSEWDRAAPRKLTTERQWRLAPIFDVGRQVTQMSAIRIIYFLLLTTGFLVLEPLYLAQEQQRRRHTLPDEPAKAWTEVEKVHQALRPPEDWRTREPKPEEVAGFQKQVREAAVSFANKAREFIERFPTNENVGDARITVVHALTHAVAAGDADAEKQIGAYVASVLADKSIPEDDRAGVLLYAGNAALMKRVGMRLFTEGMSKLDGEFETASVEAARAALKQFPTNSMIYTMLVAIAQRSERERQKELATEILNAPGAPPGAKALAVHLL